MGLFTDSELERLQKQREAAVAKLNKANAAKASTEKLKNQLDSIGETPFIRKCREDDIGFGTAGDLHSKILEVDSATNLLNTIDSKIAALKQATSDKESSSDDSSSSSSSDSSSDDSSIGSSLMSGLSNIGDGISSAISKVVNGAESVMSSAKNKAASLLSSASEASSNAFSSNKNTDTDKLANSMSSDQGPKETSTQVKELTTNSAEAIKRPNAFTSATDRTSGVLNGATSKANSDDKDSITGKFKSAVDSISKKTGSAVKSVTEGIGSVTKDLKDKISSATSTVKSTIAKAKQTVNTVVEPVKSSLKSVNNTIRSAVTGAQELVRGVSGTISEVTSGITGGAKGIIGDIASCLPDSIASKVESLGDNYIDNLTNKAFNGKLGNALSIANSLADSADGATLTTVLSMIAKKKNGSISYGNISDLNGLNLSHLYGVNTDDSTATSLYKIAQQICPGVNKSNTMNYYLNKDMFDTLIALAIKNGMSDLLAQLMGCAGGEASYADERTRAVVATTLPEAIKAGSATTVQNAIKTNGVTVIGNAVENMRVLGANLDPKEEGYQHTAFKETMKTLNLTTTDLVKSNVTMNTSGNTSRKAKSAAANDVIFSGNNVAMLCTKGDTSLVADAVGGDDQALLICAANNAFGNYA